MAAQTDTLTRWTIDPMHSEIQFKVKHLVISTVTGYFKSFDGFVESNGKDFTNAKIDFSILTASIDTNQPQRDTHLKSADFFNVEKYPKIFFTSTACIKLKDNMYKLLGNLTIRDVVKPVELQAEYGGAATDSYGQQKAGFEVTGKINRKEFGLVWDSVTETGAIVLADEVKLIMNVQITRQSAV